MPSATSSDVPDSSDSASFVSTCASTYAFVAASCAAAGSVTFCNLLLLMSKSPVGNPPLNAWSTVTVCGLELEDE